VTYEWDPAKAAADVKKHRVSFDEAASVFLDPSAFTFWDPDHSTAEHDRPFNAAADSVRWARPA
jgi:uncharacterized DUF497 family protein